MFGFGERKIKINQLPEEKTETKPQSKTEQKLTYTEKETENKDNYLFKRNNLSATDDNACTFFARFQWQLLIR